MKLIELIEISLINVSNQGLKSVLTILGVVIGIATIIALISLGQGLNAVVEEQFELMGMNTIMVEPGSPENMLTTTYARLRPNDAEIIESIPGVTQAIPFYTGIANVKVRQEETSLMIIGVDITQTDYLSQIGYLDLIEGRNLRQGDRYSIIIYDDFAKNTFEKELKLRENIELNGQKFRIIGISKSHVLFGLTGMNLALVNKQTAIDFFNIDEPMEIAVIVDSREDIPRISEEIERRLERDHGEKDFYLMTMDEMLDSANIILGLLQIFLLGLAAISLLVGGIGIMNTMLMNVMERTNEIGLMKAVGATNNQILKEFITESAIIGLIGGTIGTIIGISIALFVSNIAENAGINLPITVSIELIGSAILFGIIVGVIAGFVPAQKASKLDPVDALRYE